MREGHSLHLNAWRGKASKKLVSLYQKANVDV